MRADKSKYIYKINPSDYQEILKNKITENHKIDHRDTISQINNDNDSTEQFMNSKNKSKTTFIQFDIIEFYPSITKKIQLIVLTMQKKCWNNRWTMPNTLAWRKTILRNNESTWVKTDFNNFDVSMGRYDSAQILLYIDLQPCQAVKIGNAPV